MNWVQNLVKKLLRITPARDRNISIRESYTFQQNIQKNRIWYQGEPTEIEQFFKKTASTDIEKTRFWAATPNGKIRKIHSGIVNMVVDRYGDIVMADMDNICMEGEGQETWEQIAKENDLESVFGYAIQCVLALGDGAFKISTDECSSYPIIEFYEMDNVVFEKRYGRLTEIKFYTDYQKGEKTYRFEETYGKGYIHYKLYDNNGKECDMSLVEELKGINDSKFDGDFIMGVPFAIFHSNKWKGRGKALFEGKTEVLDALDEVISQWLDAVRLGRIKRYIPDDLIPRDPETGELMPANPFDNDFIGIGSSVGEGAENKIDVSQPTISYEAYVNSYLNFLDMVLQGVMSPSTLGIDLKKTDNASSQREKEKITLHVRNKIVDALNVVIPQLADVVMKTYDLMCGISPGEYKVSLKFGEYASPDFDSTVGTVSKAKQSGIMSIEKAVDELYGDSLTEEEKETEVARLKAEQGIVEIQEPALNVEGMDIEQESAGLETNLLNGAQIASLMNVIKMVKEGSVTRREAISIITSTLGISRQNAESFIEEGMDNVSDSGKQKISDEQKGISGVIKSGK